MTTVPHLAETLREVLTTQADALARPSGFVQRRSKLTGAAFVQALVFGWLADPQASVEALAQAAAAVGVPISPQGLDQRCGEVAAVLLEEVLAAAVRAVVVAADPVAIPLLQRFTAVALLDSSTIALPAALAPWWPGCGGTAAGDGAAALKIEVRFDLCRGRLEGPLLLEARRHDNGTPLQDAPLPPGALRIADLGFFDLGAYAGIAAQDGYWLSRLHVSPRVYGPDGQPCDVLALLGRHGGDQIDTPVTLGAPHLPARLLAARVPPSVANARRRRLHADAKRRGQTPSATRLAWCEWTLLVTNAPLALLSLREALVLARARWQIELLFKLWKSHGHIDTSRSGRPWRVLCEVYAKLLAMLVQHWLFLVSCWAYPDRSLVKAAHTVRQHALHLACALGCPTRLAAAIAAIQRCLAAGCRLNRRKTKPNTYQLLLDPTLGALA